MTKAAAATNTDDGDRDSLRRRNSAEGSTLSPLPDIVPRKVFPGQLKLPLSTPRQPSHGEVPLGAVPFSYEGSTEELERQAVDHDTILQHFTLRKRPSSNLSRPGHPLQPALRVSQPRWSFARLVNRLKRRIKAFATGILDPITPIGWFMMFREAVLLLVMTFEVFFVPFRGLFLTDSQFISASQSTVRAINMIVEALLMADCALNFNTAQHDTQHGQHVLVYRRIDIAKRYIRGSFACDFLGSLPFECIAALRSSGPLIATSPVAFHIENALRLLRVRGIIQVKKAPWVVDLMSSVSSSGQERLGVKFVVLQTMLTMTVILVLASHYLACVWHAILTKQMDGNATTDTDHMHFGASTSSGSTLHDHYFACLLHVVSATFGHVDATGFALPDAFHTMLVIAGVQVFAYFVGTLSVLVSNTSFSTHSKFQRKMQSLTSKMDKMQLPVDLQKRVQQYYAHLWAEYDTLSSDVLDFSRDLTRPLALEVGLYRYMHLVMRVPFWSDCSPDFVSALILSLQVRVFLRDDYVVHRGEIGTEMYMIHRGVCERTGSRREAARLTNGNFFAEIAILMDYKRATSVRALTHMELCVLGRPSFRTILARYHRDRQRIVTRIVRTGLESKDYPEMWQDVVLIGARQSCREGDNRRGDARVHSSSSFAADDQCNEEGLSAAEAAEVLVNAMDVDEGFNFSHVVRVHMPKLRCSCPDNDERQHKYTAHRNVHSPQANNSSMSSNGHKLDGLRRSHSVILRSQEQSAGFHASEELPPTAPVVQSNAESISTRMESGLRVSSNRSLHSTASGTKSSERTASHRLIEPDLIADTSSHVTRDSLELLQQLTEVVTRLEKRIIRMEQSTTLPLLPTLPDPSRGDDESEIDLKLSLDSEMSTDRASGSSTNKSGVAPKVRQPGVHLRGIQKRRFSFGQRNSNVLVGPDSAVEAKAPRRIVNPRRSMSFSSPAHQALEGMQTQHTTNDMGESAVTSQRVSRTTLADALWISDQP